MIPALVFRQRGAQQLYQTGTVGPASFATGARHRRRAGPAYPGDAWRRSNGSNCEPIGAMPAKNWRRFICTMASGADGQKPVPRRHARAETRGQAVLSAQEPILAQPLAAGPIRAQKPWKQDPATALQAMDWREQSKAPATDRWTSIDRRCREQRHLKGRKWFMVEGQPGSSATRWTRRILRAAGFLLLAGVGFWLLWTFENSDVRTSDAYITGRVHPIAARVNGTVLRLLVDDNQQVRQGQVLAEIDPADFQARIQLAHAQVDEAGAQDQQGEAQVRQAEAAMIGAKAVLIRAGLDFDRAARLIAESPRGISQQDYDAAKANDANAEAAVKQAQAQRAAGLAAEKAAAAAAETGRANLFDAELAMGYTKILAPVSGRVGRRTLEVGAQVAVGQTLMTIVDDDIWVVANYKETQLPGIHPGSPVLLVVDALPDVRLRGTVESFSPATGAEFALLPPDNATGNFTKVVQRVPVKIRFAPEDLEKYRDRLAPGLSVEAAVGASKNSPMIPP